MNPWNRSLAAAALVLTLASLGSPAAARITGTRTTTLEQGCGALQDEADGLLDEYKQSGTTAARRTEILTRLIEIGQSWYPFCSTYFGDITLQVDANPCSEKDVLGFPELCDTLGTVTDAGVKGTLFDPDVKIVESMFDGLDQWHDDPKSSADFDFEWTLQSIDEFYAVSGVAPYARYLSYGTPSDPYNDKFSVSWNEVGDLANGQERWCTVTVSGALPPVMTVKCTDLGCANGCRPD